MKKAIKRIAALAMALTIAGAGTSVSGVFSANVLTAEAATVSANYVSGALLKRAEFVNWIYIKAQRPNVTDPSVFSDLPNNSQYVKPIMWAYKNGIVSGYAGGKFGVNDPITFEQAALGAKVQVPGFGESYSYTIAPGTQTGSSFRLRGKGVPDVRTGRKGDLYVKVVVEVPTKLNRKQKKAVEAMAESLGDDAYPKKSKFDKLRF